MNTIQKQKMYIFHAYFFFQFTGRVNNSTFAFKKWKQGMFGTRLLFRPVMNERSNYNCDYLLAIILFMH